MQTILIVQCPLDPTPDRRVLSARQYVVGTDADCDIVLTDEEVAPKHAVLLVAETHVWVLDLGSGYGTYLNGELIDKFVEFPTNDLVQVGRSQLQILRSPIISVVTYSGEALQTTELSSPSVGARFPRQSVKTSHFELPPELTTAERYIVGRQIARGGMGMVLEALEVAPRRKIALKVMLREDDASSRARFIEEAQITAQLEHPNIVPLHELSVDSRGHLFYTMKMVKGLTLKDVLSGLRLGEAKMTADYPLSVLLVIFQKICDALAFAHSRRVIHRDLKPANIMIGEFGEVMVMDWGLAKIQDPLRGEKPHIQGLRGELSDVAMTLDGAICGTPNYMSPEQARGDTKLIEHRSDIYALGAILYEILTLSPVVEGRNAMEILTKVKSAQVVLPQKHRPPMGKWFHLPSFQIPTALVSIVMQCLALEPRLRYLNVVNLQEDVAAFQNGRATSHEMKQIKSRIRLFVRRYQTELSLIVMTLFWTVFILLGPLYRHEREEAETSRRKRAINEYAKRAHERAGQAVAEVRTLQRSLSSEGNSNGSMVGAQKLLIQTRMNLESLYEETEPMSVFDVAQ